MWPFDHKSNPPLAALVVTLLLKLTLWKLRGEGSHGVKIIQRPAYTNEESQVS